MTNAKKITVASYITDMPSVPWVRLRNGTKVYQAPVWMCGPAGAYRVLHSLKTGSYFVVEKECRVKPGYFFGRQVTEEEAHAYIQRMYGAYLAATTDAEMAALTDDLGL